MQSSWPNVSRLAIWSSILNFRSHTRNQSIITWKSTNELIIKHAYTTIMSLFTSRNCDEWLGTWSTRHSHKQIRVQRKLIQSCLNDIIREILLLLHWSIRATFFITCSCGCSCSKAMQRKETKCSTNVPLSSRCASVLESQALEYQQQITGIMKMIDNLIMINWKEVQSAEAGRSNWMDSWMLDACLPMQWTCCSSQRAQQQPKGIHRYTVTVAFAVRHIFRPLTNRRDPSYKSNI